MTGQFLLGKTSVWSRLGFEGSAGRPPRRWPRRRSYGPAKVAKYQIDSFTDASSIGETAMKFGFSCAKIPLADSLQIVRKGEELGYDMIWIPDQASTATRFWSWRPGRRSKVQFMIGVTNPTPAGAGRPLDGNVGRDDQRARQSRHRRGQPPRAAPADGLRANRRRRPPLPRNGRDRAYCCAAKKSITAANTLSPKASPSNGRRRAPICRFTSPGAAG